MALSLEYLPGGSLLEDVNRDGPYERSLGIHLGINIVSGVEYLHSVDIWHRDLKPGNILLSGDRHSKRQVRIADLGFARKITASSLCYSLCGTPEYMAPEIWSRTQSRGYSYPVDVWSFGVTVFAFFSGYEPFAFGDAARQCTGDAEYEAEVWESLYDIRSLLACVLVTSRRDRLTAMEARRRLVIAAEL